MGKKRAEARTRYHCREEARRLGWDTKHPSRGGLFLEEQEVVDFYPELQPHLGLDRPDFLVLNSEGPAMVIETKARFENIATAVSEAQDYADAMRPVHDVRIAVGLAGTPDTSVQTRATFRAGRTWKPLTSHGYQLTQIPNPDELATALENNDATTDVRLPDFREFYEAAIAISRSLRTAKIEEVLRPKIVGAVILALYQGEFSTAHDVVISQINANVEAAIRACRDVSPERRQFLIETLKLSTEARSIPSHINSIILQLERLNIRSIMRSSVDFLGQFYEAFLRYGADSKNLGIVFTPRHITRYAVDLASVRLGMKVYDPACGTGGFLVAAFDRMMAEATTPKAQKSAKSSLFGHESNSTVWALAILNMIFRGDGKSNIELIDTCFDATESVEDQFDCALLNPPFSQDDEPERDFIDHALTSLVPGGLMVAVVPSGMLSDDEHRHWRDNLLHTHGLLGTISLPIDLFYPTGAPTSLLIATADSPNHTRGAFFAKIHNDGFAISKNKRVEAPGSQLSEVRDLFHAFRDGTFTDSVDGLACVVSAPVLADGAEFCAEQWLPQDRMSEAEFRQRAADLLRQVYLSTVHFPDVTDSLFDDYEQLLADVDTDQTHSPTGRFPLSTLFRVAMGRSTGLSNYPAGMTPYVSSGDTYNSIVGTVDPDPTEVIDEPCIAVTGFGQATVQPWRFMARGNGGSAVRILYPRRPMSLSELVWYACQINRQRWRFHYARMAINARLQRLEVDEFEGCEIGVADLSNSIRQFAAGLHDLLPSG